MALDRGTRGSNPVAPKKKRKPKAPAVPPMGVQRAEGTTVSPAPVSTSTPYRGQPHPALGRAGYTGDIFAFNRRVQNIEDAHLQRFGYKPSPGLVFTLAVQAAGIVGDDEFEDLFNIPTSFGRARAAAATFGRENAETMGVARTEELIPGPTTQQRGLASVKHGRWTHGAAGLDPDTDRDLPGYGSMISSLSGEGTRQQAEFAIKEAKLHRSAHARRAKDKDWRGGSNEWNREVVARFNTVIRALEQIAPTLPEATTEDEAPLPESLSATRREQLDIRTRSAVKALEEAREIIASTSMGVRRAEGGAEGAEGFFERQDDALVLEGLRQAIQADEPGSTTNYGSYVKAHADDLNRVLKDPTMAELFVKLEQSSRNRARGVPDLGEMRVAGYGLEPNIPLILKPFEAASQIGMSLVMAPAGVLEFADATIFDARDIVTGRDFTPGRSKELGKQVAKGVAESYRNPGDNAGFIFLDALGVGSMVAGSGARLGAAARAARASQAPTRQAVKALLHRPDPGRGQLRVGDLIVEKNLSDNALLRQLQRGRIAYLNDRLERNRREPESGFQRELAPHPTLSRPVREIRKLVSAEATVRRMDAQRRRATRQVDETIRRELLAVAGPSIETSHVFKRLPKQVRRGLTRGEEKAIFVQATDLPGSWLDKAQAWRGYHEGQLLKAEAGTRGIDVKAHDRHLAAITMAAKAMESPRDRLTKALNLSREVSEAQQLIKVRKLGLDLDTAEQRIAALGELVRGTGERTTAAISKEIEKVERFRGLAEKSGDVKRAGVLGTRLGELESELTRAGERGALKRVIPDSWYIPTPLRAKAKKPLTSAPPQLRAGAMGISAPKVDLPELSHVFTGQAIESGGIRVDTTHLLAETYGRTVRAAARVEMFDDLWKASVDKQLGDNFVALLPKGAWPDEVRDRLNKFDEGALTGREIEALSDADLDKFWDDVVVDPKKAASIPGVRWIDEALLPEHTYYPRSVRYFAMIGAAINEPTKIARLFLRPAYALNALGNVGMNLIETVAAPKYVTKAIAIEKRNPKLARTVAALNGEGKSVAFNPGDFTVQRFSHAAGRMWGAIVDRDFRGGNFYYWAERKGYKTDEDLERLVSPDAPESVRKDLVEVTERSNKGMVDFRNLSPVERNVIRHWIFVYPWVSRSFIWGMRTMFEHPVKTWTAAQLGQVGAERAEQFMKAAGELVGIDDYEAPEWFRRGGYFPVSLDGDGNPLVVNANNINSYATINDLLNMGKSLGAESPYDGPEDFLSPAAEIGLGLFTGRNRAGQKYETGRVQGAFSEAWNSLPQVVAWQRRGEQDEAPAEDPLERPSFIPGFANTYGPMLASGLVPRGWDLEATNARYWRDAPAEERKAKTEEDRAREIRSRIKDEIRTIRGFEQITEQVLGRSMPDEVREALDWQEKFTYDYAAFAIKQGRQPTAAEQREIEIDRLAKDGRITSEQALRLKKDLGAAALAFIPDDFKEGQELTKWTNTFRDEHLNSEAVATWYEDRNFVLDIAQRAPAHLGFLRKAGLWSGSIPKKPGLTSKNLPGTRVGAERAQVQPVGDFQLDSTLYEYGRQYLVYDKAERRRTEVGAETSAHEGVRGAQHRRWLDEQDTPRSVKGQKLPSFVRLDWALKEEDARVRDLAAMAVGEWTSLSDFEKELLGKKPAPRTSEGWLAYQAVSDALRGNITPEDVAGVFITDKEGDRTDISTLLPEPLPAGQREISAEYRRDIATWVHQWIVPGFIKDFNRSEDPKYRRVQVLDPITKSEYAKDWQEIMVVAESAHSVIRDIRNEVRSDYTISEISDYWDEYARTSLFPWIEKEKGKGFKQELELLGGIDFLVTLIAD